MIGGEQSRDHTARLWLVRSCLVGDEVENSACHDTLRLCLLEEELQLQVSFISANTS